MDSKGPAAATPTQIYEDFMPTSKLVQEDHFDTIQLNLPGFKKEQLRVQLTRTGILKISGQRPIGQNKWQRFHKDFPAVENCDKSKISAKFENGILHVKQPKLITSAVKKDKELPATEAESNPAKRHKTSLRDEFTKQDNADNTPAKEPAKEERNDTSTKTSEQTEAKNLPEKSSADKSSSSSSYSESTDDTTDDETTRTSSRLAANLKKPRRMMKMTLVALLVLGISLYVANMMKSADEAEDMKLDFL